MAPNEHVIDPVIAGVVPVGNILNLKLRNVLNMVVMIVVVRMVGDSLAINLCARDITTAKASGAIGVNVRNRAVQVPKQVHMRLRNLRPVTEPPTEERRAKVRMEKPEQEAAILKHVHHVHMWEIGERPDPPT